MGLAGLRTRFSDAGCDFRNELDLMYFPHSLQVAPFGSTVAGGKSPEYLLSHIRRCGYRRILLVTGRRSFSHFEESRFEARLSANSAVERISDVPPNPTSTQLEIALSDARRFKPDVILGVGGGSVLDMAKLIAALLDSIQDLDDTRQDDRLNSRNVDLLLVPTTAGSGAEATHFAVLYRGKVKYSLSGNALLPNLVVLDHQLIVGGDRHNLAASGLDALCQSIESLWAREQTPRSRKFAKQGLSLLSEHLVPFVQGDFSRSRQMQMGSHLVGHAINISKTTAPHALSYFLTSEVGVSHGVAVASTVGYFVDFHLDSISQGRGIPKDFVKSMGTIRSKLGISESQSGKEWFGELFGSLSLNSPESYWPRSLDSRNRWISSANPSRLANHPIRLDEEQIRVCLQLS